MRADPKESRERRDRNPVAATAVDTLGLAALDEARRLVGRARINIRTCPDLTAALVVQHHPFSHARRAHRADRPGGTHLRERLAHAFTDEAPVPRGVEYLRTRCAWQGR